MHRVIFVRQPGVKSERKQTRGKKHTTTKTTTNNDYDVMKKKKKKKNQNKATQGCKNSVKHTECLYSWQMFSLREPVFVRISEENVSFQWCAVVCILRAQQWEKRQRTTTKPKSFAHETTSAVNSVHQIPMQKLLNVRSNKQTTHSGIRIHDQQRLVYVYVRLDLGASERDNVICRTLMCEVNGTCTHAHVVVWIVRDAVRMRVIVWTFFRHLQWTKLQA